MKRSFIFAFLVILCGVALFAQNYKDGFYFAQDNDYTNNQKNQAVIEVKGGKISSAAWNILSLNAGAQDLKSIASSGSVANAVTWANQAKAAEDFLVSSQNVNATSVPNGPANVKPFFDLAKKALGSKAVAKGNYKKDGWFFALDQATDEYHAQNYVLITVVNGTIVDALWNGVLVGMHPSVNPSKMISSRANNYPMTGARRAWHIQSANTTAALEKVQDPNLIKTKPNGQADGISGVTIEIQKFLEMSKLALQPAR